MVRALHPVYQALGISLLVGLLLGLLVAPAVGIGGGGSSSVGPDPEDPSYTFSVGGGCYEGPREHSGWVHTVAFGRGYPTTLNATVVHAPDETVRANVTRAPDGSYELALRTVPDDDARCDGLGESEVGLGTTLARPEFVVTLDGRTVLAVNQAETTANLYPLPQPLNATTTTTN